MGFKSIHRMVATCCAHLGRDGGGVGSGNVDDFASCLGIPSHLQIVGSLKQRINNSTSS